MLSIERENRIKELAKRSEDRNIFTFSDFLNPTSLAESIALLKPNEYSVFGGASFSERQMIRFGSPTELGYEEPFPISVLKITARGGKFANPLGHRDVLGAVLNLGIERQKLGDIFINGNFSYVIADEKVAKLIVQELKTVGKNSVDVEVTDGVPEEFKPRLKTEEFSVASNRADALVSKVFNLSREEGSLPFAKGYVIINGKICQSPSKELSPKDVVAVRGLGKFIFDGEGGLSKKGKLYVTVSKFI